MKVALITGITGQDGSYLAELLLEITNSSEFINPELIVNNKITLLEYLSSSPISEEKVTNDILEEFKNQDQDVRILAYKLMLEKLSRIGVAEFGLLLF